MDVGDIEDGIPKSLREVVESGCCSACGACEGILGSKAQMVHGDHGRLRPRLSSSITFEEEAKVLKVCPGRRVAAPRDSGIYQHPIVGPALSVWRGHAADEGVRFRAATGGGLTALSAFLLTSGEVDFILHVSPSSPPLVDFGPRLSYDVASVLEGSRSRYAPCAPLSNIESVLSMGKRFAFVGKPCDVNALSNLAEVDVRVDQLCAYKLSISCGQFADPPAYDAIMKDAGIEQDEVAEFRYRGDGCPGWSPYIKSTKGKEVKFDYVDFWYGGNQRLTYQWRCKVCPDFMGYQADISVMDAWPGGPPEHSSAVTEARKHERDGWVLAVARTKGGETLLHRAQEAGAFSMGPASIEDVLDTQPHQVTRAVGLLSRRLASVQSHLPQPSLSPERIQLMQVAAVDHDSMAAATEKLGITMGNGKGSDVPCSSEDEKFLHSHLQEVVPSEKWHAQTMNFHIRNYEGCKFRIHRRDFAEVAPL